MVKHAGHKSNPVVRTLLLLVICISISSCKLMPYQSDFDCPIPSGQKCKSLYEINKMADQGMFEPNNYENNDQSKRCCSHVK